MNCKGIWIKNIWYMLAYVYDDIELDREVNVSAESFDDVLNLFAGVLSKGVARLLKRGLHRDYVDCEEEQTVIRGRIAMPGTMTPTMTIRSTGAMSMMTKTTRTMTSTMRTTTTTTDGSAFEAPAFSGLLLRHFPL